MGDASGDFGGAQLEKNSPTPYKSSPYQNKTRQIHIFLGGAKIQAWGDTAPLAPLRRLTWALVAYVSAAS